jgi:hypothetical protein
MPPIRPVERVEREILAIVRQALDRYDKPTVLHVLDALDNEQVATEDILRALLLLGRQ